jgi:hypothetical protein
VHTFFALRLYQARNDTENAKDKAARVENSAAQAQEEAGEDLARAKRAASQASQAAEAAEAKATEAEAKATEAISTASEAKVGGRMQHVHVQCARVLLRGRVLGSERCVAAAGGCVRWALNSCLFTPGRIRRSRGRQGGRRRLRRAGDADQAVPAAQEDACHEEHAAARPAPAA